MTHTHTHTDEESRSRHHGGHSDDNEDTRDDSESEYSTRHNEDSGFHDIIIDIPPGMCLIIIYPTARTKNVCLRMYSGCQPNIKCPIL